ncbi:DUF2069 domain-containing protein [Marinimicrobium sp. ABcell2]|uniref:DUF2069 domain-containing protein n=1 Tax=Marinimicrobium sp. ABcell2 TaxID=3069751 RepID=UPI0027AF873D|nr:DUF2069 domain-containing protein [Marinimicrobium sp. ABcell2]MDQ2075266.1 DUF2069 domain-containing protein [Marinimicrobium sp. ABcell2]
MNKEPNITADDAPLLYRKLSVARALALTSYVALLLLFTSTNIIRPEGGLTLWLLQCVPLLIFARGLMQQRHRTYSWLCFVILIYFTWSVTNVMSPLSFWRDWLVVILSVVLFVSAMLASRWLQHWQYWQSRQLT